MADDTMPQPDSGNQGGSWFIMAAVALTGAGLLDMAANGAEPWKANLLTWLGLLWVSAYAALGLYALTDAWKPSQSGPAKRVLGRVAMVLLIAGMAANGFYATAFGGAAGALIAVARNSAALRKAGVTDNG